MSADGDVSFNHGDRDYWIVKLDNSGVIQWQQSFGGSGIDVASSVDPISDGGYIIAGYSASNDGDVNDNHGDPDYWIIKLKPDPLLPITLLTFSGEIQGKQIGLHWTTVDEHNNFGFEIQRSGNGYRFDKIGFVNTKAADGNSSAAHLSYDFIDKNYNMGTNYYRLKQIDKDGRFTYSNIIVLKDINFTQGLISVYPNPARNTLNVKITSTSSNRITLVLTEPSGRMLQKKITHIAGDQTIVQLNIAHFPPGIYFLKILSPDDKILVRKFIKE